MLYLPFGLAPRISGIPWVSLCLALGVFASSFLYGPDVARYQIRLQKSHAALQSALETKWIVLTPQQLERQKQWEQTLRADPELAAELLQTKRAETKTLWINPWVIPNFALMLVVVAGVLVFGAFIEKRLGSLLFAFTFVGLYLFGFLLEALLHFKDGGLSLGGTAFLYVMSGAYLALFPKREFGLWTPKGQEPVAALPVWLLVSVGLIAFEAVDGGGYYHVGLKSTTGYTQFLLLPLSYFVFGFCGLLRSLKKEHLSLAEKSLYRKLGLASPAEALPVIKSLFVLNPSHLTPMDVYFNRAISTLGEAPISPENQKFLDEYLGALVAHHYDQENYKRIIEMIRSRPAQLPLSQFFKLLYPREWLVLAKRLSANGGWMEAVRIYSACMENFADLNLREESMKSAELVIHNTFKECLEKPQQWGAILQACRSFFKDNPRSPILKVLGMHVEHFQKVSQDVAGGEQAS